LERKYADFYTVPVYRGIATGYAAGCCLRCVYCWSNWSRDFPDKLGKFYSPRQAAQRLFKAAERGIVYSESLENNICTLFLTYANPLLILISLSPISPAKNTPRNLAI